MKHFKALALLAVVFSFSFSQQPKELGTDTLVRLMNAEPATLNPITAKDVYGQWVDDYVFDSLLTRDKDTLELKPEMAEGMPEISADKLHFTFKLKHGLKWHDGAPITTADIKFSYDIMMDKKVDCENVRNYYYDIDKVDVIDDYTIKFTYKKKYFLATEVLGTITIIPKHIFKDMKDTSEFNKHDFGQKMLVGSGPYKFSKWERGSYIELIRNDDYWGAKPNIKRIRFRIIQDDEAALLALKRGEIDLCPLIPLQYVKQVKGNPDYEKDNRILKYYRPGYGYIGWNGAKEPFNDKKVRQALAYLVDVDNIIKKIVYGYAKRITGPFYFQSKQYNQDIKPIPYDPQNGLELLNQAGWKDTEGDGILHKNGKKFEFELLIPSGYKAGKLQAERIQDMLKEAGIIVNIRELEWATFEEMMNQDKFDAVILGWGWNTPEEDPYQIWHSSQIAERGSNRVHFVNKEADELIEKARQEFDEKKRNVMYHRLHEIIYDEQPYLFLYNSEALVAVNKRFRGVKDEYKMGMDPRAGVEWWVPKGEEKYPEK